MSNSSFGITFDEVQSFGDGANCAAFAEEMAKRLEGAGKFHFAEQYWTAAVDLYRDPKRPDDAKRRQLRATETHTLEADALERQVGAGGLNITHHLARGPDRVIGQRTSIGYSPAFVMLRWLVVRFCMFSLVSHASDQAAPETDPPEQSR